jgi:hypothetical protein
MASTVLHDRIMPAADAAAIPLAPGDEGGLVNEAAEAEPLPGELVEPGRALALADFAPPSVGAGERLIRMAYRFGISGSALSAPFSQPSCACLRPSPIRCPAAGSLAPRCAPGIF